MTEIVVTAPARLHFGMLDPAGLGRRRFGGFGVGVESPRVVVGIRRATGGGVITSGAQADRAADFARRAHSALGLRGGVRVTVYEAIPPHIGLGSGTKLGLAIACGLAELGGSPRRRNAWPRRADAPRGRASAPGRSPAPGSWSRAVCSTTAG